MIHKGCGADALLNWLKDKDSSAVMPPKANRKEQPSCDWYLYKEHHVVKCRFDKVKYCLRIATRFEKTASHFKEMLFFAGFLLWLRSYLNRRLVLTLIKSGAVGLRSFEYF